MFSFRERGGGGRGRDVEEKFFRKDVLGGGSWGRDGKAVGGEEWKC